MAVFIGKTRLMCECVRERALVYGIWHWSAVFFYWRWARVVCVHEYCEFTYLFHFICLLLLLSLTPRNVQYSLCICSVRFTKFSVILSCVHSFCHLFKRVRCRALRQFQLLFALITYILISFIRHVSLMRDSACSFYFSIIFFRRAWRFAFYYCLGCLPRICDDSHNIWVGFIRTGRRTLFRRKVQVTRINGKNESEKVRPEKGVWKF